MLIGRIHPCQQNRTEQRLKKLNGELNNFTGFSTSQQPIQATVSGARGKSVTQMVLRILSES